MKLIQDYMHEVNTMKKFELFMGYLGNGCTCCNKAVYEHGDYKTIAHISDAGNIKLYVKPDYIPTDAMKSIENTANRHRKKTIEYLDLELSSEHGYFRILDRICDYTPYNVWKNLFDDLKGLKQSEKNELLKKIYLENF